MKDTEQTIHAVKGLPVLLLDKDQMAGHEHNRELEGFVSGLHLYPKTMKRKRQRAVKYCQQSVTMF